MNSKTTLHLSEKTYKIGVFCIDKPYFIYHLLGIGLELSRINQIELYIFSSHQNRSLIEKLSIEYGVPKANIVEFRRDILNRLAPSLTDIIPKPLYRPFLVNQNKDLLSNIDAFIVPLYDYLSLKKTFSKQLYIFSDHGISNRAYSFDNRIKEFDLFFITGSKEKEERRKLRQLTKTNHVLTGFLKGDMIFENKTLNLFNNKNKTILYNPHWEKTFTSFHKFGFQLLEFFAGHKEYNLIFAPHNRLVFRDMFLRRRLNRFQKHKNILIDFNSENNYNMTYTTGADVYIGDVSSQVLEFIFIKPRPCLFLDAHNLQTDQINRPTSWNLGKILCDLKLLNEELVDCLNNFEMKFKPLQEKASSEIFYRGDKRPSVIAAEAIVKLLDNKVNEDEIF